MPDPVVPSAEPPPDEREPLEPRVESPWFVPRPPGPIKRFLMPAAEAAAGGHAHPHKT